jgi:hypothetical protein
MFGWNLPILRSMVDETAVRNKYRTLAPTLNERQRRLWAGAEANQMGFGGMAVVIRATGLSYNTVARGMIEATRPPTMPPQRVRKTGGGRKPTVGVDPELRRVLESLVEPLTRGDPESPLRWTCKSTRKLAKELKSRGYEISHATIASLLLDMGYSLQANCKTREGSNHPDRNAQFEYINQQTCAALSAEQPAISVDTKKKELVGDFKNGGREWHPKGKPESVRVHDFIDPQLGRAIPYGVYDLARNTGWA